MESSIRPSLSLAKQALPPPLFEAIEYVFNQQIEGCVLVGGTCLAGFYAGHRRSDDMDLFVENDLAFQSAVLAVKSLRSLGASFLNERQSRQFFHGICEFNNHHFTVDIVIDSNLFRVGHFHYVGNIVVADIATLIKMKAATLVSRCGEKDLFDLQWLCEKLGVLTIKDLIEAGNFIDGGVHAESMLAAIAGTHLRLEACDFALDHSSLSGEEIFSIVKKFQQRLIAELRKYLENQPTSPLGALVKQLKKLK